MKRIYIRPAIEIDYIEEDLLIGYSKTLTQNKMEDPYETIDDDITIHDDELTPGGGWDDWDNDD